MLKNPQNSNLRRYLEISVPFNPPEITDKQIFQTMTLPPKIVKQDVGGGEEYKLFYYCKFHTAEELSKLVNPDI